VTLHVNLFILHLPFDDSVGMEDDEDVPELIAVDQQSTDDVNERLSRDISHVEIEQKKVPITILTGYLGSGKTTLLNYILNEEHGKKIAVILNGNISIVDCV